MNRRRSVFGFASTLETGFRFWNSGRSFPIASFSEAPRAANALPYPTRFVRAFVRVLVWKVLLIASSSVCGWKQPFFELAGSDGAIVLGSTGRGQLPVSSWSSQTWPGGAFDRGPPG